MSDAAPAGPATATAQAAPPPAPLTAAERAARGEAPVKLEYVRSVAGRIHVGAVMGQRGSATDGAPPTVAAAGDSERQRDVRGKSKREAKRVSACCALRSCPALALHASPRLMPRLTLRLIWRSPPLPISPRPARSRGSAQASSARCLRWGRVPTAATAASITMCPPTWQPSLLSSRAAAPSVQARAAGGPAASAACWACLARGLMHCWACVHWPAPPPCRPQPNAAPTASAVPGPARTQTQMH